MASWHLTRRIVRYGSRRSRASQRRFGRSPVFTSSIIALSATLVALNRRRAASLRSPICKCATFQPTRSMSSAWGAGLPGMDTGTGASLIDGGTFVQTLEKRQGMKIACLEEVAFSLGSINRDQLLALAESLQKSGYGRYLNEILQFRR